MSKNKYEDINLKQIRISPDKFDYTINVNTASKMSFLKNVQYSYSLER